MYGIHSGTTSLTPKTDNFCEKKCCIDSDTLYLITLAVGLILLCLGALALTSHYIPETANAALLQLKENFHFIAQCMGSDPFLIAVFTASFGLGFTIAGLGGAVYTQTSSRVGFGQRENSRD